MSGPAHLPYLVCSLWTLKDHTDGIPVVVYAWPESCGYVKKIAEDERLPISKVVSRSPEYRGKNSQFIDKILLMTELQDEVDSAVYLDADTTIHGSLLPLFKTAEKFGFAATQFNDWPTNTGMVKDRIKRLRAFPEIDPKWIDVVLNEAWPSVNGGVFACCPESPVLPLWLEWSYLARSIFISDETALHVILPRFTPEKKIAVMAGGAFNCSHKFRPSELAKEDVIVYHYHGHSGPRPGKGAGIAHRFWWPIYQECLDKNVGGMSDWIGEIVSSEYGRGGNKFLNKDGSLKI